MPSVGSPTHDEKSGQRLCQKSQGPASKQLLASTAWLQSDTQTGKLPAAGSKVSLANIHGNSLELKSVHCRFGNAIMSGEPLAAVGNGTCQ